MNQQKNKTGPHRWRAGESGNPPGRPLGARQRISEKLLADLAGVWEEPGKTVVTKLAESDPGKLAQIAYGLLPRASLAKALANTLQRTARHLF